MKLLKITRTLTLRGTATIEVPDDVTEEQVTNALEHDVGGCGGALFDLMEGEHASLDRYELRDHQDEFEAEPADKKDPRHHVVLADVIGALEDDGVLT